MKILNAVAVALCAGQTLMAASAPKTPTLKPGEPAPKLQTGKWVQGEPVKDFQKDKTYLVEFWATWCGPCRVSIPHLNELHNKYKDKGLVVIGQDCWEQDESQVEPFIKKMGDKMTYRVALDDKTSNEKGKMAETWMEAAGRSGIPSAFLVNKDGKIAWIGHPMSLKDEVVEQVMAGTFDIKKAAREAEEQEKNQSKLRELSQTLSAELNGKEWDKADATLTELEKLLPEQGRSAAERIRVRILVGKGDTKQAAEVATRLSAQVKDNPVMLNQLAWELATQEGIQEPLLGVAAKIAMQANETSKGKEPAILDTLARIQFLQGNKDEAIKTQEKAVELGGDEMKESLQKTLDSYKAGKLPDQEH